MSTRDGLQPSGKFRPTDPEQRERISNSDFENAELYLEKSDLKDLSDLQEQIDDTDMDVSTVHTPHVTEEEMDYLEDADQLAVENDAYLVVHSKYIPPNEISKIEESLEFDADYGHENQAGTPVRHLKGTIFEPGHDFVLDTAHLFCAHENYLEEIEDLLDEYSDRTGAIHFCDGRIDKDGLPLGKGEMNMEAAYQVIAESDYEGTVTLEVDGEYQEDALEKFEEYREKSDL